MEYIGGKQAVIEALRSGHKIHELYVQDKKISDRGLKELVEKAGLVPQELSETLGLKVDHNQGIIALAESYNYQDLDVVLRKIPGDGFILVLDHLEDPHNMGAIIRTALCGGVDAVIIPDDRSVWVNSTVIKVSAGSVFYMPVIKVKNISQTLEQLKKEGYWVYGADMQGKAPLFKTKLEGKLCLVVGNEGKGISEVVKKKCDCLLSIPQEGPLGSLNVSVATGIIIYDVFRQRG